MQQTMVAAILSEVAESVVQRLFYYRKPHLKSQNSRPSQLYQLNTVNIRNYRHYIKNIEQKRQRIWQKTQDNAGIALPWGTHIPAVVCLYTCKNVYATTWYYIVPQKCANSGNLYLVKFCCKASENATLLPGHLSTVPYFLNFSSNLLILLFVQPLFGNCHRLHYIPFVHTNF